MVTRDHRWHISFARKSDDVWTKDQQLEKLRRQRVQHGRKVGATDNDSSGQQETYLWEGTLGCKVNVTLDGGSTGDKNIHTSGTRISKKIPSPWRHQILHKSQSRQVRSESGNAGRENSAPSGHVRVNALPPVRH